MLTAETLLKPKKAPVITRALAINRDSLNEESRTVDIVFATEAPAPMWLPEVGDYDEILDCNEESCDLARLVLGGPLLIEHDRARQVGVIESARFENGVGIATVRFSKSPEGEREFQDVKDKIRQNFSVSYRVRELTPERVSEEDGNVFRATKWEPLEISIVSVPADNDCKAIRALVSRAVERGDQLQAISIKLSEEMKRSLNLVSPSLHFRNADNGGASGGTAVLPAQTEQQRNEERQRIRDEERKAEGKRRQEIEETEDAFKALGFDISTEAKAARAEGTSAEDFRKIAEKTAASKRSKPTPSASSGSGIEIVGNRIQPMQKSIGELFTEAKNYTDSKGTRKRSLNVEIPGAVNFRATATTGTITNYNGIIVPPAPMTLGLQMPTVADLLAQGTTNLTAVPYVLEDALTPAATTVAEGAQKPEASFDLSQQTAPVRKIAVTARVSDELFDDVPSMQSYINERLRYMVEIEEDDQLLNGDGNSPNLTGILNTSGIQTQAKGADSTPDAVHKAITKIWTGAFFPATGIVMHPNDWQEVALTKDANDQYYFGGPAYLPYGNGQYIPVATMWGLPVVRTTQIAEGTALVGNFRIGAMIFRRTGISLDSTNSNEDDFEKNLISIRAEERLALAVFRPKCFATVTGI